MFTSLFCISAAVVTTAQGYSWHVAYRSVNDYYLHFYSRYFSEVFQTVESFFAPFQQNFP